jgi:hypothetical protein
MAKLEVPEPIASWREYRDQECLAFSQLRMSRSGLTLLRMRKARLEALQPVGATLLAVVIRILCGVPALHWVGPTVAALLFNSVTCSLVAAAVFMAKTRPAQFIPFCGWFVRRCQILVTRARLYSLLIFQEACRTYPRITRAHYTRTKLRQRRVLRDRHNQHKPAFRTKRAPRCRRSLKARKSNESARMKSILQRLAADAAKSRRQRLGLAPHDPLPEEEDDNCYNPAVERSWRNPVPDSHRFSLLTGWGKFLLKALTLAVIISFVTSLLALPVAMGAGATNTAVNLAAEAGFTNFAAAEVQAQQRAELAQMKQQPHDPTSLAKQFSHGIDAHVPDGVRTKVDPAEYWKDP